MWQGAGRLGPMWPGAGRLGRQGAGRLGPMRQGAGHLAPKGQGAHRLVSVVRRRGAHRRVSVVRAFQVMVDQLGSAVLVLQKAGHPAYLRQGSEDQD